MSAMTTLDALRNTDSIREFRQSAISCQRAFSGMAPLVQRTHFLSTNAIIASTHLGQVGGPFAVIASEMTNIVRHLGELIREAEQQFQKIALHAAASVKAELQYGMLQRTRKILEGEGRWNGQALPPAVSSARDGAEGGAAPAPQAERFFSADLAPELERSQGSLYTELRAVAGFTRRVQGIADRIGRVAVRQSHFTAIAARVEAAKLSHGSGGMQDVALGIRQLAQDMAIAERAAREEILDLISRAQGIDNGHSLS
ncbi:MAG TPA: hypothetical protein VL359_15280 [bacterium]|nr:hypothetical protein [bacterium]